MNVTEQQIDAVRQIGEQLLADAQGDVRAFAQELAPAVTRYAVLKEQLDPKADELWENLVAQATALPYLQQIKGENAAGKVVDVLSEWALKAAVAAI